MMNNKFGDLQKEARQQLFGEVLFKKRSSENPFYDINRLFEWCAERELMVTFTPIDLGERGIKTKCTIVPIGYELPTLGVDDYTRATDRTWYEALYQCCIDVAKKMGRRL